MSSFLSENENIGFPHNLIEMESLYFDETTYNKIKNL